MHKTKSGPSTLPLYIQVSELLIREIASGRLADGERLPPEKTLAAAHDVTVGTLRKSLNVLAQKGLLDRIHGSGNYVRTNAQATSVYSMFRIELLQGGGLPSAQYIDIQLQKKPQDLPHFGTSSDATRIRRLRYLNDTPVALEEIWLDADSGTIEPDQTPDSLYHYYKTNFGFWITQAIDTLGVDTVPTWAPVAFGVAIHEKTVLIERKSWAQTTESVEYSRTWMNADKARYVQRLR
ncbi:MAG: GntR family transcriptional regulator [Planktomarina sp.]